jgi:hypothetical protein
MARLAASLATGARVQPHLAADWYGDAVRVDSGPALVGNLGLLRAGMRAVVQVGSAAQAFAQVFGDRLDGPLRCNTYALTGTGQVGSGSRSRGLQGISSAWFVGWHQPAAGEPLVFACMVSHAHGDDSRTGGQVCAPIVARLLDRLYPDVGGSVLGEAGGAAAAVSGSEPESEPESDPASAPVSESGAEGGADLEPAPDPEPTETLPPVTATETTATEPVQ